VTLRWEPSTAVDARICRIAGARVRCLGSGSLLRCRFVLGLAWCSLIASCGKDRAWLWLTGCGSGVFKGEMMLNFGNCYLGLGLLGCQPLIIECFCKN
jgi:hypothetical protein